MSAASATPPWTLQQIHANAANWTLHGDAQLLDIMRGISGNLERRCTATRTNIDTMLLGLDRANLRLENTTNKMLSLKNLQFIEARVQDDIEAGMISVNTTAFTSSNITAGAADTTDNNELMTTVAAVRTAVDNGLSMLNRCYEKVILHLDDDSDADDDDNLNESRCSRIIATPRIHFLMPDLLQRNFSIAKSTSSTSVASSNWLQRVDGQMARRSSRKRRRGRRPRGGP